MATLQINRSNEYINRLRDIKLFLDDEKIGTIGNHQSKDFDLAPGYHTLLAKIDWGTSNAIHFTIVEGETKIVELSSFAQGKRSGGFMLLYQIIFASKKYLVLKEMN